MTTETPLTCYICGQTNDDWMTVDMIGLFKDQEAACERFKKSTTRNRKVTCSSVWHVKMRIPITPRTLTRNTGNTNEASNRHFARLARTA